MSADLARGQQVTPLDDGPWAIRLAIGIIALPTVLIGLGITPVAQLGALVLILLAGAVIEAASTGAGPRPAWRAVSEGSRRPPAV